MISTPRSTSTRSSVIALPRVRHRHRVLALGTVGALVLAAVGGALAFAAPAHADVGPTTGIRASFSLWSATTGTEDTLVPDADGTVHVPTVGDFVHFTATPVDASGTATGDPVPSTVTSDVVTDTVDEPYDGDVGLEFDQAGLHHVTSTADGFTTVTTVVVAGSTATPPAIDGSVLPVIATASEDVARVDGTVGGTLPAVTASSATPTTFRVQFLPDQAQSLPAGITLDPDGTFSGTASAAEEDRVVLTATNANGSSSVLLVISVTSTAPYLLQESLQGFWGDQPTYTADSDGNTSGTVEVPAAADTAIVSADYVVRAGYSAPSKLLGTLALTSSDPSDHIDNVAGAGFSNVTFGTPGTRVLTLTDGTFVVHMTVEVAGASAPAIGGVSIAVYPQWNTTDHATARVGDPADVVTMFVDTQGRPVAAPADLTVTSDVASDGIAVRTTPGDAIIIFGAAGTHTITVRGGGVSATTTILVDPKPTPPAPPGHGHHHHHHGKPKPPKHHRHGH